jgi:hypothetical protein
MEANTDMKTALTITQMLIRASGVLQLILGVLFWIGLAKNLVLLHMGIGILLTLLLWVMAFLAGQAGAKPGRVILTVAWGAIMALFGLTQAGLLPGSFHWVIQVIHLLVGVGAIGQAEGLTRGMKAAPARATQS